MKYLMDSDKIARLKEIHKAKDTKELMAIWMDNDTEEWDEEALVAMEFILRDRGEELPHKDREVSTNEEIERQRLIDEKNSVNVRKDCEPSESEESLDDALPSGDYEELRKIRGASSWGSKEPNMAKFTRPFGLYGTVTRKVNAWGFMFIGVFCMVQGLRHYFKIDKLVEGDAYNVIINRGTINAWFIAAACCFIVMGIYMILEAIVSVTHGRGGMMDGGGGSEPRKEAEEESAE